MSLCIGLCGAELAIRSRHADVTDPHAAKTSAQTVVDHFDRIEVLVNNAGDF